MKKIFGVPLLFVLFLVVMMCLPPTQANAREIDWYTTSVEYQDNPDGSASDVLVIEGYFSNNTDKYINYIYEFHLTAFVTNNDGPGYTAKIPVTFRNFEKMIDPYGESHHRFRIRNAEIVWPIDEYEVEVGYMKWKYSSSAG